jgi:uncharacterized membrane protein YfcA
MDSLPIVAEISAVFLLAGFVKGVIGLGLPTVAIALLSVMMAPAQAAALLIVPSLVTNIWQAAAGPNLRPLLRRLWPMLAGICLGTWAAAGIITGSNGALASAGLGAALVIYAALGLSNIHIAVSVRAERWLAPVVGLATGAVTGATGVFTLPAVAYLQAIGLQKDDLVQALGLSFAVSTVALALALMDSGVLRLTHMGLSAVSLASALAGMALGQIVRARVRPESFRLFFFIGLVLLGAHLFIRAFF